MDLTVFQRDISNLGAALAEGMERIQWGSYADRNPGLGKMIRCAHCRQRRREFATLPCCNASHAHTQRAWDAEQGFHQVECAPRVVDGLGKTFIKRFLHKKHSNLFRHQIHDMALSLQDAAMREATQYLLEGLPGFWEPRKPVEPTAIPAFAERVVRSIRKHAANQKRKQQQTARRINFNLLNGLGG